ncbi:YXWGXW repeat-containing protein [Tundrisphaera lichenicola]|uniref:YXWGXW repeat-containing protein n=1 Tax=Tundrisphaera lichenicola TaxID=2029860 RepID=UPI003EBCB201
MIRPPWRPVSLVLTLSSLSLIAPGRPAEAQVASEIPLPSAPGISEGAEILTRGPIHEAFAEPIIYDPTPSPAVPKEPPPPVEETPPDQKPEGANVNWIPGYWAWDDTREDYLWISGLWRDIPPGRQWVPGYWGEAEGGFRWVPGAWTSTTQPEASYYPTPPASLEAGPNCPAPSPNSVWTPGYWDWQGDRFTWRPGFWIDYQPDWVWVPAHYVWTPGGCLFVDGYWDWPVDRRGTPFAPVYFAPTPVARPRIAYTPTVTLVASAIWTSVFIQPNRNQYCFGDYYGQGGNRGGAVPWYDFHHGRRGYDPLFAHYSARESRKDPRFLDRMRDDYQFRRDHPESRPARTYIEQERFVNRTDSHHVNGRNSANDLRNVAMARPISQVAGNGSQTLKFTHIDESHRRELNRQGEQFREFRQQRANQERRAKPQDRTDRGDQVKSPGRPSGPPSGPSGDRPRRLAQFRSPITAPLAQGRPKVEGRPQGRPSQESKSNRPNPTLPQQRIAEQRKDQQQRNQAEQEKVRRLEQINQQAQSKQPRDQAERARAGQRQQGESQKNQPLIETVEQKKFQAKQAEQAKVRQQQQQAEQQKARQHQQQAEQAKARQQQHQAEQQKARQQQHQAEQAKARQQQHQAEQQKARQQQQQAEQAKARQDQQQAEQQKSRGQQDRPQGKQQDRPGENKDRPRKKG